MIKGVRIAGTGRALSYLDTLELPIIENTPNEEDLKDSMAEAMKKYPDAAGVLVRRHGVYVWGKLVRNLNHFFAHPGHRPRCRLGESQDTDRSKPFFFDLSIIH
jgi:hypothetical protein